MVNYMKKGLIVLAVFLTLFGIYKIRNREETAPVVLQENVMFNLEDYNVFYLNLEEEDINSSNLSKYITSDMTIISINPFINPIYSEKIGSLKYKFTTESYKKNMSNFIKYYKKSIKDYGFLDDLSYIDVNGIKLNEIEIYARGSDIVNFIYQKPKTKYKNFLNESYNYLNI